MYYDIYVMNTYAFERTEEGCLYASFSGNKYNLDYNESLLNSTSYIFMNLK